MRFIRLTLSDTEPPRSALIRLDLVEQVRQRGTGSEIWLGLIILNVCEPLAQVQAIIGDER